MIALLLTRRLWLLAAAALAACGGGGGSPGFVPVPTPEPAPPPAPAPREIVYAHYGDSLTSGGTVPRLQAHMPGSVHLDRSYGGSHARHVIDGIEPWASEPFAQAIQRDGADWIVLRFGGAEALAGMAPAETAADIDVLVGIALAAGKRVAVVGAFDVPLSETVTPEIRAVYLDIDQRMRALAASRGVPYIDVLGVPIAADEMHDPIHPGPAAQERVAVEIAERLAEIIKQLPEDGQ